MRYAIAFFLLLMTTKGAAMILVAITNLQSDYYSVPLYAASEIESKGADEYLAQLMLEHQGYLNSMLFGVYLVLFSLSLWSWWYRKYFAKAAAN